MINQKKETLINHQKKEFKFFGLFMFLLSIVALLSYYNPKNSGYSIFNRTWGFDLVTFYSVPGQILIFFLAILIVLPQTNIYILKFIQTQSNRLSRIKNKKTILFLLLSIASIFLFYLFRVKYFFLGDFNLRLEQIMRQDFLKTEYLTMKILYSFSMFGSKYGFSANEMFILYSCILGGVFVFMSFLIADLLGKSTIQKVFYFLSQICTSLLLVFFGYIEIYATPIVLLSIYIYFGLRYLVHKKQFYLVILTLLIAIASHLLCLAAIPSLFVVWYFNNKSKLKFITSISNKKIALIISVLVIAATALALRTNSSFIIPIIPPANIPDYLSFFSIAHFWELLNGQILSCGVSFVCVFYLLYKLVKEKTELHSQHYFLLAISGCILLIILIANLHRGSGDWDIMAFTAITLNLLNTSLLNLVYKSNIKLLNYLQISIIGLNTINAVLWININHTDKSIQKIEKMLINDPGTYYTRLPNSIQLGIIYKINHLEKEAATVLLNACNNSTNKDLRPCVMYAKNLFELGKMDEAQKFYEELLLRSIYIPDAYMFLLDYYQNASNNDKFVDCYHRLFDAFMEQPNTFLLKHEPKTYLVLFEYLYKMELPNNNKQKLDEITFAIEKLKGMKTQSKK